MDVKDTSRDQDFERLLLLLTSKPRPGFEPYFEVLTRREVSRLMPVPVSIPVSNVEDEDDDGEG